MKVHLAEVQEPLVRFSLEAYGIFFWLNLDISVADFFLVKYMVGVYNMRGTSTEIVVASVYERLVGIRQQKRRQKKTFELPSWIGFRCTSWWEKSNADLEIKRPKISTYA
jgi:hypothetical protein